MTEAEPLLLSGLQHYKFCPRQWALIHIEGLWAENFRTTDGKILHENAHDKGYSESRGDLKIIRGLQVVSYAFGVTGECDVVEFRPSDNGVSLPRWDGLWQPYPVEYKRGRPGPHTEADALQLCGQAMCLEEMLCCSIPEGALYYGETRHREPVVFTPELRAEVQKLLSEMHQYLARAYTPKVKPRKGCASCSMADLCLPKLGKRPHVKTYLRSHLEDLP